MKRSAHLALPLLVAVLLAVPAGAAEPVRFSQVLKLVSAGVGDGIVLKQVAAGGPGFSVGIPQVLSLKEAGASDDLIDGLMELAGIAEPDPASPEDPVALPGLAPEPKPTKTPDSPDSDEASFRIYREAGEDGRQVIHITNLDSAGRRIGGPVPETAPRNAYISRDDDGSGDPGTPETYEDGYGPAAGGGGAPPVIVNIFTPENEPVVIHDPAPGIYGRRYVGGTIPGVYGGGPFNHRGYGHGRRHPFGVPSPPGSYSHFKRYHSPGSGNHAGLYNGALYGRALNQRGYALPVPYHSAGASQLNRMRANVRLGH